MTASFQCPHCDATYPLLPTLYGRTVRCSTCKKPFRLRGDGVAEAVEPGQSSARRKARTETEKEELTKAFISQSNDNKARKPPTKRLQKKQENKKNLSELRASMSSALSAAASEAIANEGQRKQDGDSGSSSALETRRSQKSGTQRHNKAELKSGPVLTNQGQRERTQLLSVVGCCLLILLGIGGCLYLIEPQTEAALALEAFTATTNQHNDAKKRMLTYRQRCWLISYDGENGPNIIVNADKAQLGDIQQHDLTPLTTIIESHLTGLVDYPDYVMWAENNKENKITECFNQHKEDPSPNSFYQALNKENIKFVTYESLVSKLNNADKNPFLTFMLSALLAGTTDNKGQNKWADKILAGDLPHHCHINEFSGSDGQELFLIGARGQLRSIKQFKGTVVQMIGDNWAADWRVFTMHEQDRRLINPLMNKHRRFTTIWYDRYESRRNRPPAEELSPDSE